MSNLISDIAGVLGIWTGVSAISLLELFYILVAVAVNHLSADRVSLIDA